MTTSQTPRCQTCWHWEPEAEYGGGYCKSPGLTEDVGGMRGADALVYSFFEGGLFWTGPMFGCVHHELKAVKE